MASEQKARETGLGLGAAAAARTLLLGFFIAASSVTAMITTKTTRNHFKIQTAIKYGGIIYLYLSILYNILNKIFSVSSIIYIS
jgi:hypothetical protein